MAQKKKVRLSDIAEKLNISTVTVSKALSNKEGVGEELRYQIKQVAEEMGYKIKADATPTKSTNGTGNIGILIPSRFFSPNSSYYWYLFNHLSQALLKRNYYSIMELLTDQDENSLVIPRMIRDEKIDGLIILGQTSDEYIERINKSFSNFILLDFYSEKKNYDSVSNDDFHCSYLITKYIIEQGHKNIRFVGNFGATTSITDRYMGFQKAMLENNLDTSISQIIDDRDEKGAKISLKLPMENMPTAFVCNCDETAAELITVLEMNGYQVPYNISVSGFDNYLPQGRCSIDLTTVFINPEDTAKVAAELILDKINGTEHIKGRHLISGSLIIRDSVAMTSR